MKIKYTENREKVTSKNAKVFFPQNEECETLKKYVLPFLHFFNRCTAW